MIIYKVKYQSYRANLYLPEKNNNKIVVLVPGLPKSSNVDKLVNAFLRSGCKVLYPDFSGTFDSGGKFDPWQSIRDIKKFIDFAQQDKLTELHYEKSINLGKQNKIILVGMSFGAIVSLLGARNTRLDKLLLLSPAFLFNQKDIDRITDFDFKARMRLLVGFLKRAYPYTYRTKSSTELRRFLYGNSRALSQKEIEKELRENKTPTLVVHGKRDTSVHWLISKDIRDNVIQNKNIKWKFPNVGHSNMSYTKQTLDIIRNFIET